MVKLYYVAFYNLGTNKIVIVRTGMYLELARAFVRKLGEEREGVMPYYVGLYEV